MKKYRWAILYGLLLTLLTAYVLLDAFVLVRAYTPEAGQGAPAEASREDGGGAALQEPVVTEDTYRDGHIAVTLRQYREYDSDIYVADVRLDSPDYLKTALAQHTYGRNITEKTSVMAQSNNAILAVNGDYYGSRERGYVIRNGVMYRSSAARDQEDLVIYADGSMAVITEQEVSAETLLEGGAQQVLSFGPALIVEGEVAVTTRDEVGRAKASNPRTAIGMTEEGHYLFIVADGRTEASEGFSLYELAVFMQSLGVTTGYNLDGGGSSAMYFNGRLVNNPTTNGRSISERSVSDIVYVGY